MTTIINSFIRPTPPSVRRALLVVQHQKASCSALSSVSTCNGMGDAPFPGTNLTIQVKYLNVIHSINYIYISIYEMSTCD